MATYVRNNAWNNGGDFSNRDLQWYARGVRAMMDRPLRDKTSWWFFAAIHGEYVDPSTPWYITVGDAFPRWSHIEAPPDVSAHIKELPDKGTRDLYWNQCQHSSWYFLPWHRGYLLALETQLRGDIIKLGGPRDWALPYWNYFGEGRQYEMPPAFRQQKMDDGSPNPLYVARRYGPKSDGNVYMQTPAWRRDNPGGRPSFLVTQDCLLKALYTGETEFGGPETPFNHLGGAPGDVENDPHNIAHVGIGWRKDPGDRTTSGLMSIPGTAALDPIFYLHHANIDRMWGSWNANGNSNPTDDKWLNGPTDRRFVMPGMGAWYFTPRRVANLKELPYEYQELSIRPSEDPLRKRLARLGLRARPVVEALESASGPPLTSLLAELPLTPLTVPKPAELLGASAPSIVVEGDGSRDVMVTLDDAVRRKVARSFAMLPPRGAPLLEAALPAMLNQGALPDRTYLKLEGVRGEGDAMVLDVYINLPDAATPEQRDASFVDAVGLFGLHQASTPDAEHGGGGLTFVLDITDHVDEMCLKDAFDVGSLRVSLLPSNTLSPGETITVGKVSIYREEQ